MMTKEAYAKNKNVKLALGRVKDGLWGSKSKFSVARTFGCVTCPTAGTSNCPHKIPYGQRHSNGICSQRMKYLKEQIEICGTVPRLVQQEELFKLKIVSDNMIHKYNEEGDMSDEFKHISKLIVTLTDKMRRQDEGIKIHKEISISIKDFNRVIDIQAKAIEEGQLDIIKEAELLADKSDNGTRPNKSPEKV